MDLRVARHTQRLDEVVAFYRDGLGLTEIGGFRDHDGYDGVFLAVPGTGAHLEFTSGGAPGAPAPHPESLLVLYLGDAASVARAVARLGVEPVPPANPYWTEHGVTVEDPDGFRVVLVPERWGSDRGADARLRASAGRSADAHRERGMDDLVALARELVSAHPRVTRVEFAGSRSRGRHHELSDWDFAVETSDFEAVARAMPELVASLEPLGQQWEPLGHFPVYQVLMRGPTKVEYLFLDETQDAMAPVRASPETLVAINTHFWDWIWWLVTKDAAGHSDLVAGHLPQLHAHLLAPLGVAAPPTSIDRAIAVYVDRRDTLEREYGMSVPRALEHEVLEARRRLAR